MKPMAIVTRYVSPGDLVPRQAVPVRGSYIVARYRCRSFIAVMAGSTRNPWIPGRARDDKGSVPPARMHGSLPCLGVADKPRLSSLLTTTHLPQAASGTTERTA
jgi:hypothetical protein